MDEIERLDNSSSMQHRLARLELNFDQLNTAMQAMAQRTTTLETKGPALEQQLQTIKDQVSEVRNDIRWVLKIIVSAIILAIIGFALKGGFIVGPHLG